VVERRDAVGAVVVAQDGRVLVIQRARAPGRGDWTLPGGKIERGESPSDAVVREVLEETGVRVRVLERLTVVNLDFVDGETFSYAIHEHLCEPLGSVAATCPGDDAADARWVPPAELEALGVSAAVRSIVSLGLTRARARAGAG
jgi:acetyl-CoA carboxylase carboxyl transferase subunit beta